MPNMKPIDDNGDLMTIDKFRDMVKGNWFIDYDGYGNLATETEVSDIIVQPSKFAGMELPEWATHVLWYNR